MKIPAFRSLAPDSGISIGRGVLVFKNVARLAGDVHVTVQNWLPKVDLQTFCADRFKFKIKIAL